jgi:hypothetical protein
MVVLLLLSAVKVSVIELPPEIFTCALMPDPAARRIMPKKERRVPLKISTVNGLIKYNRA